LRSLGFHPSRTASDLIRLSGIFRDFGDKLQGQLESFKSEHFQGAFVIGVQLRTREFWEGQRQTLIRSAVTCLKSIVFSSPRIPDNSSITIAVVTDVEQSFNEFSNDGALSMFVQFV
jgi:hypothetical protein